MNDVLKQLCGGGDDDDEPHSVLKDWECEMRAATELSVVLKSSYTEKRTERLQAGYKKHGINQRGITN